MPTLKSLREQAQYLVGEQQALVEKGGPWTAERRATFDKLDADVKAVIEQAHRLEQAGPLGAFFAGGGAEAAGGGFPFVGGALESYVRAKGLTPVAPPRLDLSEAEGRELWEAASRKQSLRLETKATVTSGTGAGQIPITPNYVMPPVGQLREPSRVLDLLPTAGIDTPIVEYLVTTGTAAAAAVAEGAPKPQSNYNYTRTEAKAFKAAHYVTVSDEVLMDFPSFMSLLTSDMLAGLIDAESNLLLNGTGVAPQPTGLLNTTGILTRAYNAATDNNIVEAVELAINDLRTGSSFVEPDAVILNPADWLKMRRLKDSNGQYYAGGPFTGAYGNSPVAARSLWEAPVTLTTKMPQGTALIGNFRLATQAYIRDGLRVETSNAAGFTSNTTDVRCEERLILTVPRPSALLKLTGLV